MFHRRPFYLFEKNLSCRNVGSNAFCLNSSFQYFLLAWLSFCILFFVGLFWSAFVFLFQSGCVSSCLFFCLFVFLFYVYFCLFVFVCLCFCFMSILGVFCTWFVVLCLSLFVFSFFLFLSVFCLFLSVFCLFLSVLVLSLYISSVHVSVYLRFCLTCHDLMTKCRRSVFAKPSWPLFLNSFLMSIKSLKDSMNWHNFVQNT